MEQDMKKHNSTMESGKRILVLLQQGDGLCRDQALGNIPYYLASAILEHDTFDTIDSLIAFCEDPDNLRPWVPSEADRIIFSDELAQRLRQIRSDASTRSQASAERLRPSQQRHVTPEGHCPSVVCTPRNAHTRITCGRMRSPTVRSEPHSNTDVPQVPALFFKCDPPLQVRGLTPNDAEISARFRNEQLNPRSPTDHTSSKRRDVSQRHNTGPTLED